MVNNIKRGDIVLADFGIQSGTKQGGIRPAIIVSCDQNNEHSKIFTVIPGTSSTEKVERYKRIKQPSQVLVQQRYGTREDTVFMAEQIKPLQESEILHYITHLDTYKMRDVDKAVAAHLALVEHLNKDYIKTLIDFLNYLDKDIFQGKNAHAVQMREAKLNELDNYCEQYGYDSQIFLDKYLVFKEVGQFVYNRKTN